MISDENLLKSLHKSFEKNENTKVELPVKISTGTSPISESKNLNDTNTEIENNEEKHTNSNTTPIKTKATSRSTSPIDEKIIVRALEGKDFIGQSKFYVPLKKSVSLAKKPASDLETKSRKLDLITKLRNLIKSRDNLTTPFIKKIYTDLPSGAFDDDAGDEDLYRKPDRVVVEKESNGKIKKIYNRKDLYDKSVPSSMVVTNQMMSNMAKIMTVVGDIVTNQRNSTYVNSSHKSRKFYRSMADRAREYEENQYLSVPCELWNDEETHKRFHKTSFDRPYQRKSRSKNNIDFVSNEEEKYLLDLTGKIINQDPNRSRGYPKSKSEMLDLMLEKLQVRTN